MPYDRASLWVDHFVTHRMGDESDFNEGLGQGIRSLSHLNQVSGHSIGLVGHFDRWAGDLNGCESHLIGLRSHLKRGLGD